MASMVKFMIFLCTLPTLRAHTHGIKLIIILGLAYLLQQGQKKGNKKPKSLWKRSADYTMILFDDNNVLESSQEILSHALYLDQDECAQLAVCRLGMRIAKGEKLSVREKTLLKIIFGNEIEPPSSRRQAVPELFQEAVQCGIRAGGNDKICRHKYLKCPHRDYIIDSILSGNPFTL